MQINYSKSFLKHYKERVANNPRLKSQFHKRLRIFKLDSSDTHLKDHVLTGSMSQFRAFSINNDLRVIYKVYADQIVFFDVGTHEQVY